MARTGFAFCEEFLLHGSGPGHPERALRLRAILDAVRSAKLDLAPIAVEQASRDDLFRVHTPQHIDSIQRTCAAGGGLAGPETPVTRESWNAALLAAGAGISAARAVLGGHVDNAFCAVRPPGHHAESDRAMGFCLFNNVAITARWLRDAAGRPKVAILDWDVHHGNGTQHAFYNDDTVYYASLHQHPHYPGTGFPHERGKNNTNLNIQMPRGTCPEKWCEAIAQQILPEFERFQPDFLLISCGFDAHRSDPLGAQLLESAHFADMTRKIRDVAGGRVVSLLEGGYDPEALAESAVAHIRALGGDTESRGKEP